MSKTRTDKNKRNYLDHLTEEERLFVDGIGGLLREDRQGICTRWTASFEAELKLFDIVCATFIHFLEKLRRKKSLTRFDEAFLILSSKMLSDAQCLKLILENGWTGTAIGVSRMVWSANTMIMFLAYHPEHIEDWFSEKHDSYQKDRRFKTLFSEGNMLRKLADKGFVDIKNAFDLQSKGLHASYFGVQVYADEGHVTFHPRPDIFKTLVLLSETAGLISTLIGWHIKHLNKSFEETFEDEGERTLFGELNTKMSQACSHLLERVFSYLADTQEDREKIGGQLLGKLDPAEWQKVREEIASKGDPPLKTTL